MKKEKFDVTGMTCSACVAHVEKAVSQVPGVKMVQVNLLSNNMLVEFDEAAPEDITAAVQKAGYQASLQHTKVQEPHTNSSSEENEMAFRWKWSLAFLVPLMYVSMGQMIGLPLPEVLASNDFMILHAILQLLLSLPIYVLNRKYFITGLRTLFNAAPNMDSLIAIGSSAAMMYGIFILFRLSYLSGLGTLEMTGHAHMALYFESGATILTLITLGKYLESRSKSNTTKAITQLIEMRPQTAVLLQNGEETIIPVEQVVVGDVLVLRSGDQVPVDGKIESGNGVFDEAALTGESLPVEKTVSDELYAATILQTGYVHFRATRVGENTSFAKVVKLVEEASDSRAPISRLADQISLYFVPIVIVLSMISGFYWLLMGYSFAFALSTSIAVLVISCPCALGLATPVAIMVGTGKAASMGILFKNATIMEQSAQADIVVFDKTGTLTYGKPVVTEVITSAFFPANKLVELAASLEKASEHPLAEAVLAEAAKRKISPLSVEKAEIVPGKGIKGEIAERMYLLGNEKLMEAHGVNTEKFSDKSVAVARAGQTPLFVANAKEVLGILAVADVARPESREVVQILQSRGKTVVMLTGDHKHTAEAIQKRLGIDELIAEVLPHEKEAVIRSLQSGGKKVAMVGDGINDAPALMRADIGIAMGGGTDIAVESADVVLLRHQLMDVVNVFDISKTVMKHIRQNLFWAFFYNIIGIPLAAGVFYVSLGWQLDPMFAAAAMSLSSVTVVLNALRINRFKALESKLSIASDQNSLSSKNHQTFNLNNLQENNQSFNTKNMTETIIHIEGMTCGHCVMRVQKALNAIEGVEAEVDLASKSAKIKKPSTVSDQTLKDAIIQAGYEVK